MYTCTFPFYSERIYRLIPILGLHLLARAKGQRGGDGMQIIEAIILLEFKKIHDYNQLE